jgi:nucleotide-binding universal stress UspA family protein
MFDTIAVGVDGSEASLQALSWALDCAALHGASVTAVIASPISNRAGVTSAAAKLSHTMANEYVQDVRETIRRSAPAADLDVMVIEGSPTDVLLNISGQVDLLVVAGQGYSGWRESLAPSLSGQLAVRTRAALCIVRTVPERPYGRIVVGHDGSSSDAAVRFAADEAALRAARLMLVTTWRYPRDTRATSWETAGLLAEGAAASQAAIAEELRRSHPAVVVETTVRLGNSVEVLAELAGAADLVIVGSRGNSSALGGGLRHSGLGRLVIGSVAIGLLRRTTCPLAIVPHDC